MINRPTSLSKSISISLCIALEVAIAAFLYSPKGMAIFNAFNNASEFDKAFMWQIFFYGVWIVYPLSMLVCFCAMLLKKKSGKPYVGLVLIPWAVLLFFLIALPVIWYIGVFIMLFAAMIIR